MFPKFGTVTKIDYKKAMCKIALRDERSHDDGENFESGWLYVAAARAKDTKSYWMPKKGEAVVAFTDENCDEGVVLCSHFTEENKPEGDMKEGVHVTKYSDGTVIKYDENTSKLSITAVGDVSIKAESGTVKIEALTVEVKATTAKIEATTATIKASAGTASLLDTLTGLSFHTFVPAP